MEEDLLLSQPPKIQVYSRCGTYVVSVCVTKGRNDNFVWRKKSTSCAEA